jgi:hypothetical protein
MPCLLGCFALAFPRIALVLVWFFAPPGYIGGAFGSLLWPVLGFIFLPLTTLVYAWAINSHGSIDGLFLVALIVAVLVDLGLLGGGASSRRTRVVTVREE